MTNDSDVLVLLIYWVWKAELHSKCEVQMDCWNGEIININETSKKLGPKCLQLLGMHSLTCCDNVSYPFSKGKISVLNILLSGNFPALNEILGEENATENYLKKAGQEFFAALYGMSQGISMNAARHKIYTRKKGKPMRIMALPPTDANLFLHVQRAYLQMILWKVADQPGPPTIDIGKFGWNVKEKTSSPAIATIPPAPPSLIDILSCGCKAEGKACSYTTCSCHKSKISCSVYCMCGGVDGCYNPFLMKIDQLEETDGSDISDVDDN